MEILILWWICAFSCYMYGLEAEEERRASLSIIIELFGCFSEVRDVTLGDMVFCGKKK